MKTPRHVVAIALAKRSMQSPDLKGLSGEIAAYLLDERRTGELDSLIRDIMQYRADHGIVEVVAVTAHPLNAAVRVDIEKQVKHLYPAATMVVIAERHDKRVIGGVRLELANQQLDLSVRNKLNHLKQLTAAGKE
ncbi:MAG: F0F1 ATP synthase subunit delta [Candidatus Saccharibacteria bacterium]